ncbi:MAG: GNAT family N-acetyltransferase [Cyanobacteria bacterium P01_A01_bin.123]
MVWLETKHLILRDFQQQNVHQLAPILVNLKVMEFSPAGILSTSQTQVKIDDFIALHKKSGFGKWAVIFKETNELIGYCGIAVEQVYDVDERQLGYRLDPKFWNLELATEAASATIQYGFNKLRFLYILGIVERANIAFVRVL